MANLSSVIENLKGGNLQRILAFGSSNTERMLSGMHWFDCLDLGLQQTYGRNHRCIGTGIGGHTTANLLARFEQDAAFYQPHMVIITIGGNDCNPAHNISVTDYRNNLYELHSRFTEMNCAVVFQTYYSFDPERSENRLEGFYRNMQVVREVAADSGSDLIDHLSRWEPFRKKHPSEYLKLMNDGFHVNYRGNMVMGLDIARQLGLNLGTDLPEFWEEAKAFHTLMDEACK